MNRKDPSSPERNEEHSAQSHTGNEPIKQDLGDVTFVVVADSRALPEWNRKPQECDGDYYFDGTLYVTRGVASSVSHVELFWMLNDLQAAVQTHKGLDYLQVYECADGRVVWIIASLSKSMLERSDYAPDELAEAHTVTVLLPSEY